MSLPLHDAAVFCVWQDGTVRCWRYDTGQQLHSVDFNQEFQGQDLDLGNSSKVAADEVTTIMSRTRGVADVRCVACCQRNKMAAVSFDQ